ncbi:MAG: diaminopimelate decarboxylase [Chloroflexi bacterium]|nr:diaminopimelate decarboxylase [Chloroflexota bacterium]
MNTKILSIFPITAKVGDDGCLSIGDVDITSLVAQYGTPLYVYDENTLRYMCQEYQNLFAKELPDVAVAFAGKAFMCKALATLLEEEGLSLDIISQGELAMAVAGGFNPKRMYLHGNNKTIDELTDALLAGVGYIVADGFDDLQNINDVAAALNKKASVLLRLTPNVDPHTHRFIITGQADSKFGFALHMAEQACCQALAMPYIDLHGFHCHIGSQIMETEPFVQTVQNVMPICAKAVHEWGVNLRRFNLGGGYAIAYNEQDKLPNYKEYVTAVCDEIKKQCQLLHINIPAITIEPGRSLVGRAGVALYTVGNIKERQNGSLYIAVDGGMGDNIRPAMYEAKYLAAVANNMLAVPSREVSIAGRFCESSDILIHNIKMPLLKRGDIIAVPASGAYSVPMASNYNGMARPAIVFVKDGHAKLVRRRETIEDLLKCEI